MKCFNEWQQSPGQVTCYDMESNLREFKDNNLIALLMIADALNSQPKPLMTPKEVAQHLNVGVRLVQSLATSGEVRSVRVGKFLRFQRGWLSDFIRPPESKSRH